MTKQANNKTEAVIQSCFTNLLKSHFGMAEAVAERCSVKKVVFEISQNSREN